MKNRKFYSSTETFLIVHTPYEIPNFATDGESYQKYKNK